jgi:hypothetical protein
MMDGEGAGGGRLKKRLGVSLVQHQKCTSYLRTHRVLGDMPVKSVQCCGNRLVQYGGDAHSDLRTNPRRD